MDWLVPSVAGTLLVTLTLLVSYLYVYHYAPSAAMRLWTMAWAYYALRMVVTLATLSSPNQPVLEALKWITAGLNTVYLLFGTLEFAELHRPDHERLLAGGLLSGWILVGVFGLQDFLWTTIPLFSIMGLAYIFAGYAIWRDRGERHLAGAGLVSSAFFLWGLHKLDFPFLRPISWFAPIGFWLGNVLGMFIAVGSLVMVMTESRHQLRAALDGKADLVERVQGQAGRFFALSRAIERISVGRDQEQLLQDIVAESMDVLDADRCAIYLRQEGSNAVVCPVFQGLSTYYIENMLAQVEGTPGASLMVTGKPLIVADAMTDPAYRPFRALVEQEGFRGITFFPLHYKGSVIGALSLYSDQPRHFSDDEIDTAMSFAHVAASAIVHSRALAKEHRRASELEALREVSMQITGSLDLPTVLETVAKHAREIIGATDVHLFMYDQEKRIFSFGISAWSPDAKHPKQTIKPRRSGLTATVAQTGTEIIVNQVAGHDLFQDNRAHSWSVNAVAGFPIKLGDRVVGVLNAAFDVPHTFSASEVRLLNMLAGHAAIAIGNANLYRNMADLNRSLEQRVQTRTEELRTLMELGQKLAGVLSQEELTTVMMNAVYGLLSPDAVVCLLSQNPHTSTVAIKGALDFEARLRILDQLRGTYVSVGGQLAANAELNVLDVSPNQATVPMLALKWPIPSSVHAELRSGNRVVGLLCAYGRGADVFGEEDERYIKAVAQQASNAMARLEAQESRQRSRLQAILDSTPDGLVLLDEERQVVVASPTAQEMISLLADLDEGGHIERFGNHSLEKILSSVENDNTFKAEIVVGTQPLVFDLQAWPVYERGERLPGLLIRIADSTRERRTQEQLFQASKLASVGELAAGVAHEINNPLTVVIGFCELLMKRTDDEEQRHMIERISTAGQRTRKIVQGLLQFSRGLQTRETSRSDMNDLVAQTVSLVHRQIELDGIDVNEEFDTHLPWVTTDSGGVGQIILNLLQNARDAICESRTGSQITVRTEAAGAEYVRVIVEDDGPGIPTDVLSRIFDPFFTTKPPGQGTGLGLSISHRIARELGGNLTVHSATGQGTSFSLSLPVSCESPVRAPAPGERKRGTDHLTAPNLMDRRVLVVDDEVAARELIEQLLLTAGAVPTTLDNGKDALEHLLRKGETYDLILLDIKMPGLSGTEMYKQLVLSRPRVARRVMFVTGEVISEETANFLTVTGRPALSKPFSRDELIAAIGDALAD